MKYGLLFPCLAATALAFATPARAQSVQYDVSSLGANAWRYSYVIVNSSPTLQFDEVTIYFDVGSFQSLSLAATPAAWDPLVIQPDSAIPADGFLDVIHPGGPVAMGASFSGFSIDLAYLGTGTPGAQRFELYDSSDFSLRYVGETTLQDISPVPEAPTLALLLVGLAAGAKTVKRRASRIACTAEA